jgi:hypothetical protein
MSLYEYTTSIQDTRQADESGTVAGQLLVAPKADGSGDLKNPTSAKVRCKPCTV